MRHATAPAAIAPPAGARGVAEGRWSSGSRISSARSCWAELTSQALMAVAPEPVVRVSTRELDQATVDRHAGATWVVENIHGALGSTERVAALARALETQRFVRIEYDYNWCRARSPVCHRVLLGSPCTCTAARDTPLARLYEPLHRRAEHVFYMSAGQLDVHRRHLGSLLSRRTSILGSCFSDRTIDALLALGKTRPDPAWLVVSRWGAVHDFFKGAREAAWLARTLGLPVRTVGGVGYEAFLGEMARSTGLIYLPNDLDPSPRTVIEARLMGRRLILNANVLHKDETWFRHRRPEAVAHYLRGRPAHFWQTTLG
jgi:hypothetical protein